MITAGPSRMSFLFSLRGRLFFLICLATLPALLFTFFVARNERIAAVARTEQDALHLARLASREHAHQIRGARALLLWLGEKLAAEGLTSPIVTDPSFLPALLAGHPQLANIGVLSADGEPLTSAFPLKNRQSWKDNPAYRAALKSVTVETGTYVISPIFERPTLNHAVAVRDDKRNVIAVLFNGLDLGWFAELASQAETPDGPAFYIADQDGNVLATGGPSQGETSALADLSGVVKAPTGRKLETDGAGVVRYVVTVPLAEMPGLLVAVSLPYDKVVERANTAFFRTLVGLGILTLFNVVAAFVAAEVGFLRGLRSLAHVARRFGAGDLSARADIPKGQNEFSLLVNEFNTMAETVAFRHREAIDAHAKLRALAGRLQQAREMEARRISRELHDEIGQLLTSLKIDLSQLQSSCPSSGQENECASALRERTSAMSQHIDSAVGFVRRISAELRPGVLDKLGLVAALEWQAEEARKRTGLAVGVVSDVEDGSVPDLVAVTLFRIAQEALTNVVRHANARSVEIVLTAADDAIVMSVHDDGQGVDTDAVESRESLGMIGMRERAMLISGRVDVKSASGRGTEIIVTAPMTLPGEVDDADLAG